jgi:hypothetical protein
MEFYVRKSDAASARRSDSQNTASQRWNIELNLICLYYNESMQTQVSLLVPHHAHSVRVI